MSQAPFLEFSLGNLQVILRDAFWLLSSLSYLNTVQLLATPSSHKGQDQVSTLKLKFHQVHSKSTSGSTLSHSRSY